MYKKFSWFILIIFGLQICIPSAFAAPKPDGVFRYDANGNLPYADGKFYIYNNANKLVEIRKGSAHGALLAEYVYDYRDSG